jgi:integrase/recombinase XerD
MATTSSAVAAIEPMFTEPERLALAGFLAGYTSLTREAYAPDLRQYASGANSGTSACSRPAAPTSNASPGRWKRVAGPARPSPAGCARSPGSTAMPWRRNSWSIPRPRMSAAPAWTMTRTRPGWTATSSARSWSPLALNGLRVSEATGADIEALGVERGHRTLTITRKGGKVVTIPLAPRTARAIDLAVGERLQGPVFLAAGGQRLDRHGAARIVRRTAARAGITKPVGPHTLRHAFITAALDAGVPLRDVQEAASHADPRTPIRYDRARGSLDRHATYIVAAYVAGAAR